MDYMVIKSVFDWNFFMSLPQFVLHDGRMSGFFGAVVVVFVVSVLLQ
jgi:hypothetical protein